MKIACVVATKDRPKEIRNLLESLSGQSRLPDQVIIVDASSEPADALIKEYPSLAMRYLRHPRGSLTAQRNVGIEVIRPEMDLICFFDDDITLRDGAMEAMMAFWERASPGLGGCSFNLMNHPARNRLSTWLKRTNLAKWLGLYSRREGEVMRSGWQVLAVAVPSSIYVEWLQGTAMVWRRDVMEKFRFDEWFEGYGYLEDLDFSYSVAQEYRLAIVAEAGFDHHQPPRPETFSFFKFGRMEVRNRLYFVRKHNLSVARCLVACWVNIVCNLAFRAAYRRKCSARMCGNLFELAKWSFRWPVISNRNKCSE